MEDGVQRRLADIERRLEAIETALGITAPTPAVGPAEDRLAALERKRQILTADVAEVQAEERVAPELPAADDFVPPAPIAEETPEIHPPPLPLAAEPILEPTAPLPYARRTVGGVPANATFEQTVGLKWAGWIGAIVLIIGAGLGFKYAYDQGWLGLLPPGPKIGLLALCGLGMLGAGEWVFRRVNRMSAAGFFGAGTAILFLASYAGHAWYGLYIDKVAIALMAASTMAGILVAARADLVSVAVLAILGGLLGPIVLGSKATSDLPLLGYLLILQIMALGLCARRATPKWWPLRGLMFTGLALYFAGMIASRPGRMENGELALMGLSALLFHSELCFSTWRFGRTAAAHTLATTAGGTFSLLVTAGFAACCLVEQAWDPPLHRGATIVFIAVAAFLAGLLLRRLRSAALGGIVLSLRAQAILLLILAVPVSLQGPSLLFGWALLSIALAVAASRSKERLQTVGAVLTWILAIGFWAFWSNDDSAAAQVWLTLFGQPLEARLVTAACLALAGHVLAALLRRVPRETLGDDAFDSARDALLDVLAAILFAAALLQYTAPTFATLAGTAYALALFGASYVPLLQPLGMIGLLVLSAAAIKWATVDVLATTFDRHAAPQPQRLLFNGQVLIGMLLAACFGVVGWLQTRRQIDEDDTDAARQRAASAAALVGLMTILIGFTLSMEIYRFCAAPDAVASLAPWRADTARDFLFTVLWSLCVGAWLAISRLLSREKTVRDNVLLIGVVLALVLSGKYVIFDVLVNYTNHGTVAAQIGLNLSTLAGVAVLVLLSAAIALARRSGVATFAERCALVVPLLLLVIGSAEIDRYAVAQSAGPAWIVRQVGWSIYWAALAIVMLVIGFARHLKALRVAALGLLGVTLLKVTLIDLSTAGSGWRILSFLGLGALLLLTSVLYGKFSERPSR